jgi:hypothetical protein
MDLIAIIDKLLKIDSAPENWPIPVSKSLLRKIRAELAQFALYNTPYGEQGPFITEPKEESSMTSKGHADFFGMTGTRQMSLPGFLED